MKISHHACPPKTAAPHPGLRQDARADDCHHVDQMPLIRLMP